MFGPLHSLLWFVLFVWQDRLRSILEDYSSAVTRVSIVTRSTQKTVDLIIRGLSNNDYPRLVSSDRARVKMSTVR
ncbi:hypothetical protein LZ32DRAFT_599019 [Colletotrichum eremochloae]|nr:hypothetical protein LZ32DRAFT_599019 [Colletotrichum eremochloae]